MDTLPTTATRRKVIKTVFPVDGLHDADSLPEVLLRVDGVSDDTEPTVTKLATGTYEYTYPVDDTGAVNGNVITEEVLVGYDGIEYHRVFDVLVGTVEVDEEAIAAAVATELGDSIGVTITPILATTNKPIQAVRDIPSILQGSEPSIQWTLVDGTGAAVNLSGKTVRCVIFTRTKGDDEATLTDPNNPDEPFDDELTGAFKYETGGDGITISGASNNIVTLQHDSAKTDAVGDYEYVIWNVTDLRVLVKGKMPIEPALVDVT